MRTGRNSPPRDFGIHDTFATGWFDAMGAIGSIAFAFNTVVLPELQVTKHVLYSIAQLDRQPRHVEWALRQHSTSSAVHLRHNMLTTIEYPCSDNLWIVP